jgi:hypothetical protein
VYRARSIRQVAGSMTSAVLQLGKRLSPRASARRLHRRGGFATSGPRASACDDAEIGANRRPDVDTWLLSCVGRVATPCLGHPTGRGSHRGRADCPFTGGPVGRPSTAEPTQRPDVVRPRYQHRGLAMISKLDGRAMVNPQRIVTGGVSQYSINHQGSQIAGSEPVASSSARSAATRASSRV